MIFAQWFLAFWLTLSPTFLVSSAKYAGTGSDVSGVGTLTWTQVNATGACDGGSTAAESDVATVPAITHYLRLSNFGFSIPGGSTINGVEVSIDTNAVNIGTLPCRWYRIRLVNASSVIGSVDKSPGTGINESMFTTTTVGGAADTWSGEAATDWNDSDSGVALAFEFHTGSGTSLVYVDCALITVTYTVSAGGTAPRRSIVGRAQKIEHLEMESK